MGCQLIFNQKLQIPVENSFLRVCNCTVRKEIRIDLVVMKHKKVVRVNTLKIQRLAIFFLLRTKTERILSRVTQNQ